MANLTIVVDDEVLRRARVRAAEQGTSVNAVLRDDLARYATATGAEEAADTFLRLARSHPGRSGTAGRWKREDLYLQRGDRGG